VVWEVPTHAAAATGCNAPAIWIALDCTLLRGAAGRWLLVCLQPPKGARVRWLQRSIVASVVSTAQQLLLSNARPRTARTAGSAA
jgi:hypothetical protein